jgi:alkanesulfonate monooxygenase SsuD/methylene tetrahydromethanopterin reductase-like flavin-dependent oxidoreductase (luciferase family)
MIVGQRAGLGIIHGFGGFDAARLAGDARQAEALGFDMFSLADHLHGERPTLEPWTALTWAAAATERIEVMSNVLALPYRSPAVTAKMAETLDRLSAGRLVLGLGAGRYDAEFSAFGLAGRTPGQKVSALGEAVRIIRGLWNEPALWYEGTQFRVRGARIEPRPSHPVPIWLGAYGPRALRLAGALADGWIPSLERLEYRQALAMRAVVRASAEAAGRDPDEITCGANLIVIFGKTRSHAAGKPHAAGQRLTGNAESIAERLIAAFRDGFTFLNAGFTEPGHRELFAAEVMPLVRNEIARGHDPLAPGGVLPPPADHRGDRQAPPG